MQNINEKIDLAIKLFNSGKEEEGLRMINLLISSNKKNKDLLFIHVKMNMGLKNIEEANLSLSKILKEQPSNS